MIIWLGIWKRCSLNKWVLSKISPLLSSLRTAPTKDNTSQAKSNPSKRHSRILLDGGLLKLELENEIFTMWSNLEVSFGPQKSHCQSENGISVQFWQNVLLKWKQGRQMIQFSIKSYPMTFWRCEAFVLTCSVFCWCWPQTTKKGEIFNQTHSFLHRLIFLDF